MYSSNSRHLQRIRLNNTSKPCKWQGREVHEQGHAWVHHLVWYWVPAHCPSAFPADWCCRTHQMYFVRANNCHVGRIWSCNGILGWALAALVHVWNQCPIAAVDNAILFKLWHGCKPDIFHFWVWGLIAYVYIQKDKHNTFKPHHEKCVFIGYSNGYKDWKFYNSTIKHTIISERADFDEWHTSALHSHMIHHSKTRNGTMEVPHPYTAPDTGDDTPDHNPPIALQVLHPGGVPDPHVD